MRLPTTLLNKATASAPTTSPKLCWLDLRGMGLSMIERLSIEEALLRHDDRNWAIIGTHEPWPNKYLTSADIKLPKYITPPTGQNRQRRRQQSKEKLLSQDCMVVMGIGGKPEKLLNIEQVKEDNVLVIKRFSGGGTVVLDTNSVWTTLIGRTIDFPNVEPYPRSIMEWSANDIFIPTFQKMNDSIQSKSSNNNKNLARHIMTKNNSLVPDVKSCTATENLGRMVQFQKSQENQSSEHLPMLKLRENDYIIDGNKKIGGNAQSIVKGGWLHHTSFLWDYDSDNMQYLTLPDKRPDYRLDRSHDEFLVRLSKYYGRSHHPFVTSMKETCQYRYEMESFTLTKVMNEIINPQFGCMQQWFAQNRTKIIDDF